MERENWIGVGVVQEGRKERRKTEREREREGESKRAELATRPSRGIATRSPSFVRKARDFSPPGVLESIVLIVFVV